MTLVGDTLEQVLISGNPTRVKQIIVNLVDNALKHNRSGGTASVSVYAEGDSAVLRAGDSRIGIPESSIPFIFDRFYRADKMRTRATGGVGIGLSIAKAICNAHRATISVDSREGQGSVFTVAFPLLIAESPASETRSPQPYSISPQLAVSKTTDSLTRSYALWRQELRFQSMASPPPANTVGAFSPYKGWKSNVVALRRMNSTSSASKRLAQFRNQPLCSSLRSRMTRTATVLSVRERLSRPRAPP